MFVTTLGSAIFSAALVPAPSQTTRKTGHRTLDRQSGSTLLSLKQIERCAIVLWLFSLAGVLGRLGTTETNVAFGDLFQSQRHTSYTETNHNLERRGVENAETMSDALSAVSASLRFNKWKRSKRM